MSIPAPQSIQLPQTSPYALLGGIGAGFAQEGLSSLLKGFEQQKSAQKQMSALSPLLGTEGAAALSQLPPQAQGAAFKSLMSQIQLENILQSFESQFGITPNEMQGNTRQQNFPGEEILSEEMVEEGPRYEAQRPVQQQDILKAAIIDRIAGTNLQGALQAHQKVQTQKELAQDKREFETIKPGLESIEKRAQTLNQVSGALDQMEEALDTGNLGFFSKDNLANFANKLVGPEIGEQFRSPEGALFLNAGKEFLLGNLNRVSARGLTQYLERQIKEFLPLIGRSEKANRAVVESLRFNEKEIPEKEKELLDEAIEKYGYTRKAMRWKDEQLKKFVDEGQKELTEKIKKIKGDGWKKNTETRKPTKMRSGMRARNPNTGEVLIFDGEKWVADER